MTEQIEVFRGRFNRILASLEKAIGNHQVAWLSTLSIVSGAPLLIESKTSQMKLARAVASVMRGAFGFTQGFDLAIKRISEANVFYVEGLDALYCKAPSMILAHHDDCVAGASERVFIVIARMNPRSQKHSPVDAILNRFASFAAADFDGESVTDAEAVVSLDEVLAMRDYVKKNIGFSDPLVDLLKKLGAACQDNSVIPAELAEYLQDSPTLRAFAHLRDLSMVVAASQGRTQVDCNDVRMLVETTMTHRFTTVSVSPFNRFDLGQRIAKALLAKIPNNEPAHA